jgi:hypothetical protein
VLSVNEPGTKNLPSDVAVEKTGDKIPLNPKNENKNSK